MLNASNDRPDRPIKFRIRIVFRLRHSTFSGRDFSHDEFKKGGEFQGLFGVPAQAEIR